MFLGIIFLALKIHCSTACKQLLDRLGGYILEERGEIKIKGKGEMVTYWLVGEKAGNHIRQRGRAHLSSRPKSSLRNTGYKLSSDRHKKDLASSLDSPKKLRFANDSPTSPLATGVEILDETTPFTGSKRNSCPNLKVGVGAFMLQPTFSRSVERKLCYQPHRLSTTSLVEALTFSSNCAKTPNGRSQQSPSRAHRGENPKRELSPPEESLNDCWPLLEQKNITESDRETSV